MPNFWPFKRKPAVKLESLVVPKGSTILLRPPRPLTTEQFALVKSALDGAAKRSGVEFLVFPESGWDVVVIGAPE